MRAMDEPLHDDGLDIEREADLVAYLRAGGWIGAAERPACTVLAGGVSNRTVLVRRKGGEAWVLKQALRKLRVAVDWFSDPARIHREALALRYLPELAEPGRITPLVFEDEPRCILAMQAVPEPHENWKSQLLRGAVDPAAVRQFAELLGQIHGQAARQAERLQPVFDDSTFFESLRLEPYYGYAAEQVPRASRFLHALITETRPRRQTLVHSDYSPKNILVHHEQIVLLDHEVIHWGEPAFDLGFSLTHLLSKAHHLPEHRSRFAAAARDCWRGYQAKLSALGVDFDADFPARVCRHTLGCLLARVAGRSPLEYLDDTARVRQRDAVVALMAEPPEQPELLFEAFLFRVAAG